MVVIMTKAMEEFINILMNEPETAYDYFANNYYEFSKSEIVDITKEFIYAIYNIPQFDRLIYNIAMELESYYDE